jgi:putative ABC transport system substrate-binding protein
MMHRRSLLALLGTSAAAWPLATRAQQDGRVRRIALLLGNSASERDPAARSRLVAFRDALAKLGWVEGRNLRIDLRFGANDLDRIDSEAAELVALGPEIIVAAGGAAVTALKRHTQSIPIVFVGGGDPIVTGLATNFARPGDNATGFTNLFYAISGKWVELLKEAAPHIRAIGLLFNPDVNFQIAGGEGYATAIAKAAPTLGLELLTMPARDGLDLVRAIDQFAREQDRGLLVLPPGPVGDYRKLLFRLAEQHRLPAIYPDRSFVAENGLISYGSVLDDLFRGAATYVDRILRGAKVSELPVQFPTKFELVVNLKTAKAIGLTIPEAFLLRADELIE